METHIQKGTLTHMELDSNTEKNKDERKKKEDE
jgi:hypothetical protein